MPKKKGLAQKPDAPKGTQQMIDGKAMIQARPPKKKEVAMPSRSQLQARLAAVVAQPQPAPAPAPQMPDNAKGRKKTQILSQLLNPMGSGI